MVTSQSKALGWPGAERVPMRREATVDPFGIVTGLHLAIELNKLHYL
jgi:hypothetical protein